MQRIDFLKVNGRLLLSELEDDCPYMAIESLSDDKRQEFIENFKKMVYMYYDSLQKQKTKILKR